MDVKTNQAKDRVNQIKDPTIIIVRGKNQDNLVKSQMTMAVRAKVIEVTAVVIANNY